MYSSRKISNTLSTRLMFVNSRNDRVQIKNEAKTLHQQKIMSLTNLIAPSCCGYQYCLHSYIYTHIIQYSVSQLPPPEFFPKRLEIFSRNFTCLLYVPIYAGLQIFIQLSATLTKLCHIKRDHHHMLKMSTIGRNACWVVALNMA